MFVALGIKHTKFMRMRRVTLSSATCTALLYFSALLQKQHDFRINVTEHKLCVVIFFYNFCLKHFSFYGKFSEILSQIYLDLHINTFTAIVDLSRFNNSCLKSPASTLVDLTFQSRALRSFSLNQLRNLSL